MHAVFKKIDIFDVKLKDGKECNDLSRMLDFCPFKMIE